MCHGDIKVTLEEENGRTGAEPGHIPALDTSTTTGEGAHPLTGG